MKTIEWNDITPIWRRERGEVRLDGVVDGVAGRIRVEVGSDGRADVLFSSADLLPYAPQVWAKLNSLEVA